MNSAMTGDPLSGMYIHLKVQAITLPSPAIKTLNYKTYEDRIYECKLP